MIFLIPIRNGKPYYSPEVQRAFKETWQRYDGKSCRMIIKPEESVRSLPQNRCYWGLVLPTIANDIGYSTEELHEALKMKFLPREYVMLGDKEQEVRKSTTQLSTIEFNQYLEAIIAFAGTELGVSIPPPTYDDTI